MPDIKSPESGANVRRRSPKKGNTAQKTVIIVGIVVLSLLTVILIIGLVMFNHLYGLINYQPIDTGYRDTVPDDPISDYTDPATQPGTVDPDVTTVDPPVTGGSGQSASDTPVSPDTSSPETAPPETTAEFTIDFGSIADLPLPENVVNILLIGRDADSKYGRSDSMIVVSINTRTKKIVLTSIMRDTYAFIPLKKNSSTQGYYKLNAAHYFGGPAALIETLKVNFGINIDNYASVDFTNFTLCFDALGGLDIVLTAEEIEYLNRTFREQQMTDSYIDPSLVGKPVHLNGEELLHYARARHLAGSDFARTNRQRTVLTAAFNKIKTLNAIQLYTLMTKVLPLVTTDLTQSDCLKYIWNASSYAKYEIKTLRLPVDGYYYIPEDYTIRIYDDKRDAMMQIWHDLVDD